MKHNDVPGLSHYLSGQCELDELVYKTTTPNFSVVFAGEVPPNPSELLSSPRFEELIQLGREYFDYVIIDCPAGIEQGFKNAIAGADKAVVVTTPEVSAVRDADRIIGLLEANEMKDSQLIVNRLRPDMVKRGDMMSADDVVEVLAVNLLGIVPDDEDVVVATNRGIPLAGNGKSLAGQAVLAAHRDGCWNGQCMSIDVSMKN
jgi:septum site-determining protein MinD